MSRYALCWRCHKAVVVWSKFISHFRCWVTSSFHTVSFPRFPVWRLTKPRACCAWDKRLLLVIRYGSVIWESSVDSVVILVCYANYASGYSGSRVGLWACRCRPTIGLPWVLAPDWVVIFVSSQSLKYIILLYRTSVSDSLSHSLAGWLPVVGIW